MTSPVRMFLDDKPMSCSDHGCVFGHPGGMGTNGGCLCLPNVGIRPTREEIRDLRKRVKMLRDRAKYLEALLRKAIEQRDGEIELFIPGAAEEIRRCNAELAALLPTKEDET